MYKVRMLKESDSDTARLRKAQIKPNYSPTEAGSLGSPGPGLGETALGLLQGNLIDLRAGG